MLTLDRRFLFGSSAALILPGLVLCALIGSPRALVDRVLTRVFPEEQRRDAELDGQLDTVRRRTEARKALVRDLGAGRLTLLETAARFRDLDRSAPDFQWDVFRRGYPGDSDDERHCREVIRQLWAFEPLGPAPTRELARRLEGELADYLARGTLRLPESGE
jgi:hypothetical protein